MSKENFVEWLKDTGIKTVRTMAQSAIGAIGTTALINEVNWAVVGGTVALSGVMCILMALTNLKTAKENTQTDETTESEE